MSGELRARPRGADRRRGTRRPASDRDLRLELLGLGYLVVGTAIAVVAAWPIHETFRLALVAAAGLAVGVAAAVFARRLVRRGLMRVLLAIGLAFAGFAIVVVPVAVPAALRSVPDAVIGLRDGIVGIVVGWKQLLTLDLPLGDYQAVLVPFLVVTVVGSTAAALLVLRGGAAAPWAVLPVLGQTVFGLVFGSSSTSAPVTFAGLEIAAPRELAVGVASVAAAVAWLLIRHRMLRARALARARAGTVRQSAESTWLTLRRRALAGGLLAVAFVVGLAVAPAAASFGDRSALRDEVTPAIVLQRQASPLAAYRSWFADPRYDEVVLTVDGDVEQVGRLRLAALDRYDGEVFSVDPDARFSRLPSSAPFGVDLAELELEIGDAYEGVWVPAPAELAAAPSFAGPRADALTDGFHRSESGDAVDIAPVPDGGAGSSALGLVPGDRYSMLAVPSARDATRQAFGTAEGAEDALDADLYPQLAAWVEAQGQPRTGAGYLELIDRLRARGYLSHALVNDDASASWTAGLATEAGGYQFLPSYAGHSRARIETLFGELIEQERRAGEDAAPEMLVAGVGDDEQFAVAAALIARHLGFDSRVVLGVRLAGTEPIPGIATCDPDCTGAAVGAWVEVAAQGDWVPVDVTPQFTLLPTDIAEGEQLPKHPTVPDDARSEPIDPERAQSDAEAAASAPVEETDATAALVLAIVRIVALSLALLAFLALPVVAILLAKPLRRHSRRRASDPELRILGAWEEVADAYEDAGRPLASTASRRSAAQRTGRTGMVRLAASVDEAVFAAHPPAPEAAEEAWRIADAERAELTSSLRKRDRVAAALSLRSFVGRLRTRQLRAPRKELAP
ncbi:transglutaminase-like domain-containing protein [Agromyces aerolatus]|uniref:transglutaminase-like domain-containing protein n=1 Tax=Agromyces sp. LY-1074 TaxID=3074080 RepID=UPI002855CF45|nr:MULTISPECIES: transglutaminase-like domain-containing protein [unclassified Agromyces]MDR5701191.1 transglutaminase-like domain-containing protein [Agromyces sp. LY-1074]MDR5706933.1 transglutaminase-like domain-containing protein [Agromyces sp. LY-1358]